MIASLILFSATAALDYRFVASPCEKDIPKDILIRFKKSIRGLLSNETMIAIPKWLLVKEIVNGKSYILWGVAVDNSVLSEDYCHDEKKRSIQCFIGLVIKSENNDLVLPYEVDSFTSLFNEIMKDQWTSLNQYSVEYNVGMPSSTSVIKASKISEINIDPTLCRFFPGSFDAKKLFEEALSSTQCISVASGIKDKSEVISAEYHPLLNAVLLKPIGIIKDDKIKSKCSKCNSIVDSDTDGLCDACSDSFVSVKIDLDEKTDPDNNKFICDRCGQEVEYLYNNGECETCRRKLKWRRFAVLVSLVFLFVGLGKFSCTTDDYIYFMKSEIEVLTDSTVLKKDNTESLIDSLTVDIQNKKQPTN